VEIPASLDHVILGASDLARGIPWKRVLVARIFVGASALTAL